MATTLDHLSPGIREVIRAFQTDDFSPIEPAFGDAGMSILRRWWREEELGISSVVGDIWGPEGAVGEKAILRGARFGRFPAGAKVLDVASGIGGPGRILARHFQCEVHGIDIEPDCITVARGLSKLEGLEHLTTFQVGDRASLPVEDEIYDIVYGRGGWGGVDDQKKVWPEAFRVVRPGGQVRSGADYEDAQGWIKDFGFTDVQFHETGKRCREALELFLQRMEERRQQIVAQAGEQLWDSFYSQKTRQLAELDGERPGVVVATK